MCCNVLLSVLSEAGYLCIPAVLPVLKEVVDSYVAEGGSSSTEAQENQEDAAAVLLGVVANIFQKIIELLARRLRKDPEEGAQVHWDSFSIFIFIYIDIKTGVSLQFINAVQEV